MSLHDILRMDIFGIKIPYIPLTNCELYNFGKRLNLNLQEIFMRENLPLQIKMSLEILTKLL